MYRNIALTEEQLKAAYKTMAYLEKWRLLGSPVAQGVWKAVSAAHKRMLKGAK